MEVYLGVRQNDELNVLREYGIDAVFIEFTRSGKWSKDTDFSIFDMIVEYKDGSFKRFEEFVNFWKANISAVILPRGKSIEFENVFYKVDSLDEMYELMDKNIFDYCMSADFFRKENINFYRKGKDYRDKMRFVIRGEPSKRIDRAFAYISFLPLDYAISKRAIVYKYGKREIRPIKEFALYDFNISLNDVDYGIDFDKIKAGNHLELFKFNVIGYYYHDIKEKKTIPKWIAEYERLKSRGELPDWAYEVSKNGRPKYTFLASRYNRMEHGLYARVLKNENYICDTCPIRTKCPMYEKGAVCAYTTEWKDMGNTRNVSWVLKKLEEIIAEEYARYMRAIYIEGLSGDVANKAITQLADGLSKKLEIYYKLRNGSDTTNIEGSLNLNLNLSLNEALEEVRKMYGEDLAKKVKERLNEDEQE